MSGTSQINLVDIGANLTHESFQKDLDAVIDSAIATGVKQMVVTGACEESSHQAAQLAERYDVLFATAGVHPHHADDCSSDTISVMKELCELERVVAVGETGLDYFRDLSPRSAQKKWFSRQLEIAVDNGLPVFLHEREAHDDFIGILSDYRDSLSQIVVHCFTGTEDQLRTYLDLDCHIGMTGWICDERRGSELKDYIGLVPDDRLMIETDAPYLLPRDIRPKPKKRRNVPANLPHILRAVATAREQSIEELAKNTTATAQQFFNLPALTN